MAIGSILRGLGSKISGSALGRGAAGMGQRVASSPLGRGAANLGQAGLNYGNIGLDKLISATANRLNISEDAAYKLIIGVSGAGAIGAGIADSGDGYPDEMYQAMQIAEQGHPVDNMIRDRFGFGVDARQLTDE